jgi:hypothetical protein
MLSVLDLKGEGNTMGFFGWPWPCPCPNAGVCAGTGGTGCAGPAPGTGTICKGDNEVGTGACREATGIGRGTVGMGGVPLKNELVGESDEDDVDRMCPGVCTWDNRGRATDANPELGRDILPTPPTPPAPAIPVVPGEGECRIPAPPVPEVNPAPDPDTEPYPDPRESGCLGKDPAKPDPEPTEPATMPPDGDWRTGSGRGIPRDPGTTLDGAGAGAGAGAGCW